MISRVYIVIFFTISAVCFFDLVMTEYLVPTEPYHRDGFGHKDFPLPENDPTVDMKYKILSRSNNVFYIGGRGIFYRIDPYNTECRIAYPRVTIGTCAAGGGALPCKNVAPIGEEVDCHNYIRIVEEYKQGGDDKLLVCGTNALEPRCYTFEFDAANCAITLDQPAGGIGEEEYCVDEASYDAKELAPRNWNLNYTYLWSQRDNSESIFFAGVSKSYDKTDPIWAKHSVDTPNLGAPTSPFNMELDTYEIESRAVNEANFVGKPYEYTEQGGTFVLFFYRETAVEFINHGKIVYSRVGRVCRDDQGNSVKWSSFLKARLNCSLPDDYPAYFNEIQDITAVEEDGGVSFYAVMATPSNGVSTSALCRYRLDHIHQLFQTSKFKSPSTSKSLWLPVDPAEVPDPRPGSDCNNPSRDTTFIQNNPLLDDLVENHNPAEPVEGKSDSPLFYTDEGGRFSVIVVDDRGTTDMHDNIYYIGTETGKVLKAYLNTTGNGWIVFRYWQHEDHAPINGLEFIPREGDNENDNGPLLFAATLDTLTKLDLKHGYAQNQDQHDQVYFPYLNDEPFDEGTGVIIRNTNVTSITTCDNGEINLFCEGRLDSSSGNGNITWYKEGMPVIDTELGHLLSQTHLTGSLSLHPASFLTILALDSRTDGRYSCEVWYPQSESIEKERVYFDITVETCITSGSVEDRKTEFEKTKMTADHRSNQYTDEQVCVIEHPILCERSCPYH